MVSLDHWHIVYFNHCFASYIVLSNQLVVYFMFRLFLMKVLFAVWRNSTKITIIIIVYVIINKTMLSVLYLLT